MFNSHFTISSPNKEQFKRTHESFHPSGGSFLNPGLIFWQRSDRCQVLENTLRVEQALSAQLKVQLLRESIFWNSFFWWNV